MFLDHQTGAHPESAARLEHITSRLDTSGLAARCVRPSWTPATDQQLTAVHRADYLAALAALARRGGGCVDSDTVVSPVSLDVARLGAGAACDAVERVMRGQDSTALCL